MSNQNKNPVDAVETAQHGREFPDSAIADDTAMNTAVENHAEIPAPETVLENAQHENNDTESLKSLQQALHDANAKIEENWALFLSARAEADNIQKRAERDVSNAHKYALEKFIPELLKVKDSLELGTKAARENAEADNEQLAKFLEGSDMTITLFGDVLNKAGITMIDPQGETFNPEFHQAMTMLTNPDVPANTIVEVVQKGYTLNERLVRPAMVIVSKTD